jgi:aspartyl-tRNA(Asn)/glutamyl-tRNA(Gln) amidotransferase subunit B
VFYPDLRSASEAAVVVETLRNLLRHIGTCDGKMEEGSLRCDLNVSITPLEDNTQDEDILKLTGNRVEVKNLNSIRQIQQAAKYEAIRQAEAYINGDPSGRETRTFDVKSGKTIVIRSKEGAKDYRFMPEPDLPPVVLDNEAFGGMSLESFLDMALPELPNDARDRLQREYGLSAYLAGVLTGDPPSIQLFDTAVQEARKQLSGERQLKAVPESVANLLCNGLFALKRETDLKVKETLGVENSVEFSKVDGEQLGEIVALIVEGTISNTMAKEELAKICHDIISTSPEEMERYNMGGKYAQKIKKFLLGKAMAATGGNAHPERLNEILMEVLEEIEPDVN